MNVLLTIILLLNTNIFLQPTKNTVPVRDLPYTHIIYREERGAQKERLYADHPKYEEFEDKTQSTSPAEQKINQLRTTYLNTHFPDEYNVDYSYTKINGKKLSRNRQYYEPKNKIVIHHSAMPTSHIKTPEDEKKHLQEIQELHTFYRNRGDIGYHFLIGKFGDIYEGKAGGPGIIGAHAQFNNFNSIGINLLGNFESTKPTDAQLESLTNLLISLSKYYNIRPDDQVMMHAKTETTPYIDDFLSDAITYHKIVGLTSCPGHYLESKIPMIKNIVSEYLKHFDDTQDHTQIIHALFQDIDRNISTQALTNILLQTAVPSQSPQNTKKKYQKLRNILSQNPHMTTGQRQNITETLNYFAFYADQFEQNPNGQTLAPYSLYTKKLRNQLKNLTTNTQTLIQTAKSQQ